MSFLVLSALLAVSAVLSSCNAYYIDSSCNSYKDMIQTGTAEALDNAQRAFSALSANPRDQSVDRLVHLLFGDRPAGEGDNWLEFVTRSFSGMQAFKTLQTVDPARADREVVFFCNMNRFAKRHDGRWVDTVTLKILKNSDDDNEEGIVNECSSLSGTLAHTVIPEPGSVALQQGGFDAIQYPSQVTICPWFLAWAKWQRYKTFGDYLKGALLEQNLKSLAALATTPLLTNTLLAPIDAINLFDRILLHEFSHTKAGGVADDIRLSTGGFWGYAYGWKAARNLAMKNLPNEYESARRNADSLALFASGVRLLQLAPPQYISDSGKISGVRPTKRSVAMNGTTPEFERFAEMLKQRYSFERGPSRA